MSQQALDQQRAAVHFLRHGTSVKAAWLLLVAVLVASSAHAGPMEASYSPSSADRNQELEANARAVGIEPLAAAGGDELRVWTTDYMSATLTAVIVSASGTLRCRTFYQYTEEKVTIKPAKCHRVLLWRKRREALAAFGELYRLDQGTFACEVFDGAGFTVDARIGGRRFVFSADNPGFCDAEWSRTVYDALALLPRQ